MITPFERFRQDLWESLNESYRYGSVEFSFQHGGTDWGDKRIHLSDSKYGLPPGEACPRQLKHRLLGDEKKPSTISKLRMFETGYLCETAWLERARAGMHDRGWETYRNVEIELQGCMGTADGVFVHENGEVVIVDTKTRRSKWYKFQERRHGKKLHLENDGFIVDWPPYATEVAQLQCYIAGYKATTGCVLVGDRDGSQPWAITEIKPDEQRAVSLVDSAKLIEGMDIESVSRIPLRKNGKMPWQCDYCDYFGTVCGGAVTMEAA